ncbi:MAG: bifunctional phosphoribosylaminoimidazolecarboxamide formyltransferase/IMP cyclohydrolase, partial [Solirubrobacteraceae bacterium]
MAERTATEPTAPGEVKVRRALISVSDKRGVVDFARGLAELGVELISTGGTARALSEGGLDVRSVTDLTGFPEIMDGRVKTLHPKLYASLLARRDDRAHLQAADEQEVEWVDLVCVNLYPFEQTASTRGIAEGEVIEDIDIGGPTMIRAAAKNFPFSAVVVEPESYDAVLAELRESEGRLSLATRESLAAQAFAYTARYDTAIARWFAERDEQFPPLLVRAYEKVADLPYGENPHQRAAFYTQVGARMHVLSRVRQHGGKALSFNNLLDLNAARLLVSEFQAPACAIVKHNNPCGCALAQDGLEAYRKAFAADPMSAFGGIIALNQPVDGVLAEAITAQFVEVLFAPGYTDEALEVLSSKPNLRILQDEERRRLAVGEPDVKQVIGGVLVQDRDRDVEEWEGMQVATKRLPTEEERAQLLFAWRVCKHVRSNAIVLAQDLVTAGIGAGQMSRIDSVRLAVEKSTSESLAGAALASDAVFPFPDG